MTFMLPSPNIKVWTSNWIPFEPIVTWMTCVNCIICLQSMDSNLRKKDIRTFISTHWFLLFSFQTGMQSFMSDLIKPQKVLQYWNIASSKNYGALKLGVPLIFNSAHSGTHTITIILRLIWRIFIWSTGVLLVNQLLIDHSHHVEIWNQNFD